MKICLLIEALYAAGCGSTTAPDGTTTEPADAKIMKAVGDSPLHIWLLSQDIPTAP